MRKLKKIKAVLMTLGMIFAFSFFNSIDFCNLQGINYGNLDDGIEFKLRKAGYWNLTGYPIFIDDDDPLHTWVYTAATYEWCSGSGSWSDPFVLENITIDAQNSGSCIEIKNSDVFFRIKNCTLTDPGSQWQNAGIKMEYADNGLIINNTIFNDDSPHGTGIYFINRDDNNTIKDNKITKMEKGIFLDGRNNTIIENTLIFNGLGIEIGWSWDNLISGNYIDNFNWGSIGIKLTGTNYRHNISGNTIINSTQDGIYIGNSYNDDIIFSRNIITNNTDHGIYFLRGQDNSFLHNNINNSNYGIYVDGDGLYFNDFIGNTITNHKMYGVYLNRGENNLFYNNTFIDSTVNAYDNDINNEWDNGSLGNYWDDYGGVDADDDGIGDTPYDVPPVGGSVDNYPIWSDEDDVGPDISINSPINDEIFGIDAPNFTITITDQTLNTTWYTIDGGLTNFTFSRFEGTVNQSAWDDKASGPILLRFYANDSVGNIDFEDVNIEKDADAPTITINSPTPNQMCGVPAPSFDVIINDPHFHKKWYSLDGGENITYTTETQIDQIEWDKFGNGTVLITFYANDTLGNENSTQVKVRKDVYLPKIFIISPIPDELFEETPPFFNVEIRDPNLHKMWYRIDSGMPKIFTENESITQSLWDAASEGIIDLTFFANDTAGNVNFTSVNIIKDTLIPSIEIISPEPNEIFREIAPSFEISITEVNVVSRWYSIDGGLTNKSFIGLNGTINEILWWDAPLGPITIRFYAEDIAGNIGFEDVVVIKKLIKSLSVEIVEQSFSKEAFNITFLLYNETEHGISNAAIQLWWDGTEILSGIQNLGNGLYFVSLEPITVASGEEPILLSMIITVDGYEDKYFETFLAVDPETLEKGIEKDGEEFPFIIIIIAIVSSAGGIGATIITIGILRKRKPTKEVI